MTCFYCKGECEQALTRFIVDLEDCVVIVKNVPAMVCKQCGEKSYDDETMRRLEEIVNSLRNVVTEIAVVNYADKVA